MLTPGCFHRVSAYGVASWHAMKSFDYVKTGKSHEMKEGERIWRLTPATIDGTFTPFPKGRKPAPGFIDLVK